MLRKISLKVFESDLFYKIILFMDKKVYNFLIEFLKALVYAALGLLGGNTLL